MSSWPLRILVALVLVTMFLNASSSAEWGEQSEKDKKVMAALDTRGDFDYRDVWLEELQKTLAKRFEITVLIDQRALEMEAIPTTGVGVNLQAKGIMLRSALRQMLEPMELTYLVEDGILHITSEYEANNTCRLRMHPIHDLLSDDPATAVDESLRLMEVITDAIQPDCWDTIGGPCKIETIPPGNPRSLAILGNNSVHEDVAELLALLRKSGGMKPETLPVAVGSPSSVAEAKILKALESPIKVELADVPLADAVDWISTELGVNALIDSPALEVRGLTSDCPVTMKVDGLSLRNALNRTLGKKELTFVIKNEILLVTTQDAADCLLETRVYPLRNVMPPDRDEASLKKRQRFVDELLEKTCNLIDPQRSPGEDFGLACITPLLLKRQDVLVITETQAVHRDIAALLSRKEFRQAKWVRRKRKMMDADVLDKQMKNMGGMGGGMGGMGGGMW